MERRREVHGVRLPQRHPAQPHFPPIDPYFAGGTINYYYYGHYLVAVLVKLTGITSSVAFNLAIATVFALTIANTFSLGDNLAAGLGDKAKVQAGAEVERSIPHAIVPLKKKPMGPVVLQRPCSNSKNPGTQEILLETSFQAADVIAADEDVARVHSRLQGLTLPICATKTTLRPSRPRPKLHSLPYLGLAVLSGLLAAFFVAMLGNVDGGGQVVRKLAELSTGSFQSNLPGVQTAVRAAGGLAEVLGGANLPSYNYWDPSRVIPYTINEFPYWSFLFADLHPHMIGIGFTVFFLALAYNLLAGRDHKHQPPERSDGVRRRIIYMLRVLTGDGYTW